MIDCIDPRFIKKIEELDLEGMSNKQRIKAISDIIGDDATNINLLYEKKRILKNFNFDGFLDEISVKDGVKKEEIKEIIARKILDKYDSLDREEIMMAVKDTLDKKYNVEIPKESIENILTMRKEAETLLKKARGTPNYSPERLAYGMKEGQIADFIGNLKNPYNKMSIKEIFKNEKKIRIGRVKEALKEDPIHGVGLAITEPIKMYFGLPAKAIKASWDNSWIFRQGLKVLSADKKTFGKSFMKSWEVWKNVGRKEEITKVYNAWRAGVVSHEFYDVFVKSGLAIDVVEEFFPTPYVQRMGLGLGNVFKASDDAFTMASQGARFDLMEKYVRLHMHNNNGIMPSNDLLKDFAKIANSVSGRGGLGKLERLSGALNNIFFSARYQTANINTFRHAITMKGEAGKIARKQLAMHIALMGSIMSTASMFFDVGFNPEKSTFGKVRLFNSDKWIDVTGGLAGYLSTVVRFSGKVFGDEIKYGEKDAFGVLLDFLKGKVTPQLGVIRDIVDKRTFKGDKPTLVKPPFSVLRSLFVPINPDNLIKGIEEREKAEIIGISFLLETMGAGVSSPKSKTPGSYKDILEIFKIK